MRGREPGTGWDAKDHETGKHNPSQVKERWNKLFVKTPQAQIRGYGHGKEDREKLKRVFSQINGYIISPRTSGLIRNSKNAKRPSTDNIEKFTDVITPELCACIMGFPKWYDFKGSKTDQYKQIGNSVCPPISRAIYKAILNPPHKEIGTLK